MKKIYAIFTFLALNLITSAQNYNVSLTGTLQYPTQTCANICGFVDSTGIEYALVGAANGISVVDISSSINPIEIIQIPFGAPNLSMAFWKEIKMYKNYAYITSEAGLGLQIVDLRHLPATTSFPSKFYTGNGTINNQLGRIHALHVDTTKKFVYLYGATGLANGGAVVLDIADPWNPVYAGQYNLDYIHDGYVDNDTLYGGHIYGGYFSVIDMTNKNAPNVLAATPTPLAFCHNTWPNATKDVVFITDEKKFAYLTSFDVSNLANITELDRIRTNTDSAIVHNTHIIDNYAITSWYTEGFTITDVSRPHNMIEVGRYDTYTGNGTGFQGAWGVYPYFPSKAIVVSNIDEGLFVFYPNYVRGCYLEGNVKDSITLANLPNAFAQILGTTQNDNTDAAGNYAAGVATAATYSVLYSAPGYISQTINNVALNNGVLTTLNIKLLQSNIGINSNENSSKQISVNENPFKDYCTIFFNLESTAQTTNVEIFNASGKLIEKQQIIGATNSIQLGNEYENGVYFVLIKSSKGNISPIKIVKMK